MPPGFLWSTSCSCDMEGSQAWSFASGQRCTREGGNGHQESHQWAPCWKSLTQTVCPIYLVLLTASQWYHEFTLLLLLLCHAIWMEILNLYKLWHCLGKTITTSNKCTDNVSCISQFSLNLICWCVIGRTVLVFMYATKTGHRRQ